MLLPALAWAFSPCGMLTIDLNTLPYPPSHQPRIPQFPFAQAAARPPAGPSNHVANHGPTAAGPAAAAAAPAPPANLFPYAKLRFSWDPNSAPGMTPPPAAAAAGGAAAAAMAITPGLAVSGISGLIAPLREHGGAGGGDAGAAGGVAPMPLGDNTPISRPFAGSFGGFGSAFGGGHAAADVVAAAAAIDFAAAGSSGVDAAMPVDGSDLATDDGLAAAVPQPVKCASPDAPADPFAFAAPSGGAAGSSAVSGFGAAAAAIDAAGAGGAATAAANNGGVMVFGGGGNVRTVRAGGGGGAAAAGGPGASVMMDSFDALRLSSMSNWPMKLRGQFAGGEGDGAAAEQQ